MMNGNGTFGRDSDFDVELLAGYVLGDLEPQEQSLIESISDEPRFQGTVMQLERVAAVVSSVGACELPRSMPTGLRSKISRDATSLFSQANSSETPPGVELASSSDDASRREIFAWILAAAASLIAFLSYFSAQNVGDPTQLVEKTIPVDLQQQRAAFLQQHPDAIEVAWSAGTTPMEDEVGGDVVWDTESQTGYMRFVGLPVNEPSQQQYQLWIIDPDRDDEPVDGGVFDSTSDGELVVAIDAKLRVVNPQAFAITIEQPGGVVVSTQEQLPLLAKVAS